MTLEFAVNGVALPEAAVKVTGGNQTIPGGVQGLPSSAWYGEFTTATILVDDPFGDYDFRAWDVWTADETAAANPRVFTGWAFEVRISRSGYRNGPARVWEVLIIDQNNCLSFEVFRANSAQRPDETDLARVEFILESAPMAGTPVVAGPLTNLTDNPANLQSADYVRQYPIEALTATAGQSGKTFYVFWNQDDEELQLYYDQITAYPAAALEISNVPGDYDLEPPYTVIAPFLDAELRRAGDSVYTGELLDFVGGAVYQRNATTIDRLSPTPLSPINFLRDFMRRSDQIGLVSTANAVVTSDLAAHATEEDTITVTIRVPAAQVNDIEAGQRVTVRFQHLVGYETATPVNCIRRNVVPTEGRVDFYDVHLELSDKAKLRDLDGGDPDAFPPDPVACDVGDIVQVQKQHADVVALSATTAEGATFSPAPTPGNLLIAGWSAEGQVGSSETWGDMSGWNLVAKDVRMTGVGGEGTNLAMWWKVAGEGEEVTPQVSSMTLAPDGANAYLFEYSGVDSLDTIIETGFSESATTTPGVTITPTADLIAVIVTLQAHHAIAATTPVAGTTEDYREGHPVGTDDENPQRWLGHRIVDGTTGSYNVNPTLASAKKWATITATFYCSGSDPDAPCIAPGQPSPEDEAVTPAPDGVETTFFTRCPFADETLHVRVDATNQDGAVASYDGAAGSFTLGFAPTPTERITVNYLGRP